MLLAPGVSAAPPCKGAGVTCTWCILTGTVGVGSIIACGTVAQCRTIPTGTIGGAGTTYASGIPTGIARGAGATCG